MRRRRFLVYAAATAGAAALGVVLVHPDRRKGRVLLDIRSFVGDDARWSRIGSEYLTRAPAEHDVGALSDRIFSDIQWDVLTSPDVGAALAGEIREDFRRGRVVSLGGWVLAITEARLCALETLLSEAR